jgi:hypothetical protein
MVVLVEHIGALELPPLHLPQIQTPDNWHVELRFCSGKIQAREVRRILNRKSRVRKCWEQYYDGKEERKKEASTVKS